MDKLFNRNPIVIGNSIEQPSQELIKNTLGLWNASLEDAVKYGGDLTRAALSAMNLRGDRKYIVVDTRVTMLMPGMYPSIPGWHTDGVPRGNELRPDVKKEPNIDAQEERYGLRSPRYHLMVTGQHSLTDFITDQVTLEVPDEPRTTLYKMLDTQAKGLIASGAVTPFTAPSCTVVEFDWWNLHTAKAATGHEFRFLIRVTETDYLAPCQDLNKVIRTQQNVYVPENYGW